MKIKSKTFESANIMTVEVGTNTPMGGDAGHGGKTAFRIDGHRGSTAMAVKLNDDKEARPVNSVTIELYGDCEADTFIRALLFALEALIEKRLIMP